VSSSSRTGGRTYTHRWPHMHRGSTRRAPVVPSAATGRWRWTRQAPLRPRPAPRPSRARPSRADRHCLWACSTNRRSGQALRVLGLQISHLEVKRPEVWLALVVQRRSGLRAPGPRWPLTVTTRASMPRRTRIHRDKKLRTDARGRLRGIAVDKHRGALRFRATRDNRGDDATCPALALAMDKIKAFTMNTFTLPFFAAPNTSTATSCAKSLPSFAAPSTSSATSFAKSFTCVFHVSSKGARGF